MKIIDSTGASRRLMDMVLPLHEQINADLSKRTLAAQFPNLLYVSSRLRACAEQFFSDNEFIPTMSTREPRSTKRCKNSGTGILENPILYICGSN
jgi:hypothetical protein